MPELLVGLLLLAFLLLCLAITPHYTTGKEVEELKQEYCDEDSRFAEIDGMQVHYKRIGSGPPLLLMHGVASSLLTWEHWQQYLSRDFEVITCDLPSFAITGPHPKGDYSLQFYMRFIDQFLDHLQIDRLHVGGNSFGGFLSWNYALHAPERVDKLVLSNPAGFGTNVRSPKNPGFLLSSHPLTKWITHRLTPRNLIYMSVRDAYGDRSKASLLIQQRYYDLLLRKGNRNGFSEVLNMVDDHLEDNKKISSITKESLILWGTRDRIISVKNAAKFEGALSNSTLIIYEGIGHVPMEEIPEISAADVAKFLKA